MLIRVYIAPQILRNPGTENEYISSLLNDFIDTTTGEWFDEIDNPEGRRSICTVFASQTTHDSIYNDRIENPGRIIYISPLANGDADKKDKFDKKMKTLGKTFKDTVQEEMDKHVNHTIDDEHTVKDTIRKFIYTFFDAQRAQVGRSSYDWSKIKFKFSGEDF